MYRLLKNRELFLLVLRLLASRQTNRPKQCHSEGMRRINSSFSKIRPYVLMLFTVLWVAGYALADTDGLQKGLRAYQQKNYAEALRHLKPLAEKGETEAQRKLGVMYRHGLGVEKNDQLAISWYRKAAQGGHVKAQNSLGIMYRFGMGVEKNLDEAVHWLSAAAEQGDGKGQENLGLMYLDGEGVEQSDTQAVKWLHKSAVQGHMRAQFTLGLLTLAGRGTDRDQQSGMDWIQKSANRGYPKAAEAVAKAFAEGLYGMEKDIEKARYWYQRAGRKLQ